MIEQSKISHDNFSQRSKFLKDNTSAIMVAENVAFGYNSAENVVKAWLNSPSHKATIEGAYNYFDISAEQNPNGTWFFTNMFIRLK